MKALSAIVLKFALERDHQRFSELDFLRVKVEKTVKMTSKSVFLSFFHFLKLIEEEDSFPEPPKLPQSFIFLTKVQKVVQR